MKIVLASLTSLALASATASSSLSAAPPAPAPAPAPAAATAAPPSYAAANARPSPERMALARRFIALAMPEEENVAKMREASLRAATWVGDHSLSSSERAESVRLIDRVLTAATPVIHLHMLSILEVSALVYAREFSAAELEQMIAFAATPAGRHYLGRADFLDLDPNVMAQQQLLMEALQPVYGKVRKEMCAEHTAKRIAAGDTKARCALSAPEQQRG